MRKLDEQPDNAASTPEAGMEWLDKLFPYPTDDALSPQRKSTVAILHRDVICAWEHYEKAR